MAILTHTINHVIMITAFVFMMMTIIDYVNVLTKGHMSSMIGSRKSRQYLLALPLWATPGCLEAFIIDLLLQEEAR